MNNNEQQRQIDLEAVYDDAMSSLPYSQQKVFENRKWPGSSDKWKAGFMKHLREKTRGSLGRRLENVLEDFLKDVKKQLYEAKNSGKREDEQYHEALKALLEGIQERTGRPENGRGEAETTGVWSIERIAFTCRNFRHQIYELLGLEDKAWTDDDRATLQELRSRNPALKKKMDAAEAASKSAQATEAGEQAMKETAPGEETKPRDTSLKSFDESLMTPVKDNAQAAPASAEEIPIITNDIVQSAPANDIAAEHPASSATEDNSPDNNNNGDTSKKAA